MSVSHTCGPDIGETTANFKPLGSVLESLEDSLRRKGDRLALIDGDSGETITYSQLLQQSCNIAAGLQRAGVSPGDVVILCCETGILCCSLILGVMFTGATISVVPTRFADAIDNVMSGETVKAVFYDLAVSRDASASLDRMKPSLSGKVDPSDPLMATLLESSPGFNVFKVHDVRNHVPVVLYTNGTTDLPKGIEISDLGVQLGASEFPHIQGSILVCLPFYWVSSFMALIRSVLGLLNYTFIFANSKDPWHKLQLIDRYKMNTLYLTFRNIIELSNIPTADHLDLSSVRHVITGGDSVLPSVARQFYKSLKLRAYLTIMYDIAEVGVITSHVANVDTLQVGQVGKAQPGVEIKVGDHLGDREQPWVMGKIWVKTLGNRGYRSKGDRNRKPLGFDEFYDTGDIGCLDAHGNLFLHGRISDIMNFRGIRNSPYILEDLLMTYPAVLEVVVFGKPHPNDGHHPTAVVVLRPEFKGTVTEGNLIAYVERGIANDGLRLRGGVIFRDSLPITLNNKVFRKFV